MHQPQNKERKKPKVICANLVVAGAVGEECNLIYVSLAIGKELSCHPKKARPKNKIKMKETKI